MWTSQRHDNGRFGAALAADRTRAEGMLGRASDREVVLTRTLGEKLVAFNPGLPDDAYRDAIASVQSLQHAAGLIDLLRFEPASDRPVAKIKGEARPQAGQPGRARRDRGAGVPGLGLTR